MFHIHRWEKVKENLRYVFYECSKCGKRKAILINGGIFSAPVEARWLQGGEFLTMDEIAIIYPDHPKVKDYMWRKRETQ